MKVSVSSHRINKRVAKSLRALFILTLIVASFAITPLTSFAASKAQGYYCPQPLVLKGTGCYDPTVKGTPYWLKFTETTKYDCFCASVKKPGSV